MILIITEKKLQRLIAEAIIEAKTFWLELELKSRENEKELTLTVENQATRDFRESLKRRIL